MLPLLYAIASTISLFSLQLAEMIGLVRDLYEPILAVATVVLKILGKYQDGRLNVQNGYTWIALLYISGKD
ncbi:uncharacterized protein MJAP1_003045 [Malassezia japonica]|uniref:Uncharacterized protein n=1 Tax=Malassezia japonica TaxID=223818 RepID=A0AAF0JB24_9BASI|nr:uncharacterized protein MJAP1_003045 [Malassezia japonica]WFD40063.1 hypothetical protein MJAP1_003045 [Malassezia japonica]